MAADATPLSGAHAVPTNIPEPPPELQRPLLVANLRSFGWISDRVASLTEGRAPVWWWALFIPSVLALGMLLFMLAYQISTGVGVWGNMHPVMWAWDIVNFVWWIGIGHAGTLISAILFLLRQRWRTGVNRAAEAMTIFAVMCAGIYPALHVGRHNVLNRMKTRLALFAPLLSTINHQLSISHVATTTTVTSRYACTF